MSTRTRSGWIRSIRHSKKITFVAATDGQEDFQLTVKHFGNRDDDAEVSGELKIGASFVAEGEDSTTPRGSYEFLVKTLKVVGDSDDDFPIQPKEHTDEFLRTIPDLRGRTALYQGIWRCRHFLSQYMQEFLVKDGFVQYWAPLITSADCEGAGETFAVQSDWMDSHLTVSAQLHGEVGMMSLGKIYTWGPCFRAEKSTGRRHLSEFWMIEPEMAFFDLKQTMTLAEQMVKTTLFQLELMHKAEFAKMRVDRKHIQKIVDDLDPWPRLTYREVCEKYGLSWGDDVSAELERKLTSDYDGPVFVTHWPKELKPFYMKTDGDVAVCFDLIFPEVGELIGGSVREEDYDKLKQAMVDTGVDLESMDWYLKTRKWGTVPHAGFGLGFERLLMFACKISKIYDSIPFPVHYR